VDAATHPVMPSRDNVFLTVSIAPVYAPRAAACNRVFASQNDALKTGQCESGCASQAFSPARIAENPPKHPAINDFTLSIAEFLVSSAAGALLL
jgi:hypothetical protein